MGSKAIAANLYSAFPVLLLPPLFPVGPIHPHLCISEAPQPKPNATLCTHAQSPSRQAPLGRITPPSKRQKAAEYEMQTVRKCDQKPRVFRLFCAYGVYIIHAPFWLLPSLCSVSEHKGKHFLFWRRDKNHFDPSPHRKLDRGKGNEAAQDLAFAICNQYHQRTFVVRKKSILSRSFFGWYITTARKSDLQRFMLSTGGEVVRVTHNTLHPSRLISPHSHFRFFDECRQPVISHLSFFLLQPFHS